jgi:hypothetical protein
MQNGPSDLPNSAIVQERWSMRFAGGPTVEPDAKAASFTAISSTQISVTFASDADYRQDHGPDGRW